MLTYDDIQSQIDAFCSHIEYVGSAVALEGVEAGTNVFEQYNFSFSKKQTNLRFIEQYEPIDKDKGLFRFRKLSFQYSDSNHSYRFEYHPEGTTINHYDHHDFFHVHNLNTQNPQDVIVLGEEGQRSGWKNGPVSNNEDNKLNLIWAGFSLPYEDSPIYLKIEMYNLARSGNVCVSSLKSNLI